MVQQLEYYLPQCIDGIHGDLDVVLDAPSTYKVGRCDSPQARPHHPYSAQIVVHCFHQPLQQNELYAIHRWFLQLLPAHRAHCCHKQHDRLTIHQASSSEQLVYELETLCFQEGQQLGFCTSCAVGGFLLILRVGYRRIVQRCPSKGVVLCKRETAKDVGPRAPQKLRMFQRYPNQYSESLDLEIIGNARKLPLSLHSQAYKSVQNANQLLTSCILIHQPCHYYSLSQAFGDLQLGFKSAMTLVDVSEQRNKVVAGHLAHQSSNITIRSGFPLVRTVPLVVALF
mmetsp:Transcript_15361/g.39089  ORF Transcript_15361/g.39089 Transcript_15361/m.39089 type:complete len:284 (-) Transcript_15361:2559-3410(-)